MRTAIALSCLALAQPAAATDLPAGSNIPQFAWDILTAVTFEEYEDGDFWKVEKTFPRGYENGAEAFAISGWAVIFAPQADIQEILLVPQAEDCPFCSGGGETYGPTLEVIFDEPVGIAVPEDRITVEGRLEVVDAADTLQAFRLVEARLLPEADS